MKKITGIVLFILSLGLPAFSEGTKQEIFFRLNTKMHTAMTRRFDIDKNARYMITAGYDKTAKLWDVATGEYIKTFRPPIAEGDEGKLYCAAISPDGKYGITGGWSGYNLDGEYSVYVFEISSGEMIKVIPGFPNVINDLEFSPNGKYISVCLGVSKDESEGIYIVSVSDWTIYKKLAGYGERTYDSSFDKSGRLATGCYDGKLRLYDANFNLVKEAAVPEGNQIFDLEISPDGKKIAVGVSDSRKIFVFSGKDLTPLYEPTLEGVGEEDRFDIVAWSQDGKFLYGAGSYSIWKDANWQIIIRKWEKGGEGKYTDYTSGYTSILDLKTLANGDIMFNALFPDFGSLSESGELIYYVVAEILEFAVQDRDHLKVSPNGNIIGFTPYDEEPFIFSLLDREIRREQAIYAPASTNRAGITVTDWKNTYNPKINETDVSSNYSTYEMNRSACISPSGKYVVMGADWSIYCFDKEANLLWESTIAGTGWAVSIPDNDKVVIAACGDGTIKWFRLTDGKELLTLFIHSDGKRWLLWTPEGYYDASPGGDRLAGWHINNGLDKCADFYPLSNFSEQYYRPDVIELVLDYIDVDKAIAKANTTRKVKHVTENITEILPPLVRIVSPENGLVVEKSSITIEVTVKTPEKDPVIEYKLLRNSRPIEEVKGLTVAGKKTDPANKTFTIELDPGMNEISVLAKNTAGYSEPASIMIQYKKTSDFLIMPKLYVLAVGVSKYNDKNLELKYSAKDAKDFSGMMMLQKGKLYREVAVKLLTDKDATKENILDGLDWIMSQTTAKDVAIIYMSGHGMNDQIGELYYLPVDTDLGRLKRTGLPAYEVTNTISGISGKILYFMDSCHSGNLDVTRRGAPTDYTGVINQLSSAENGAIVFASSSGKQYSLEKDEWNNGAFTKALVEGLSGKADYTGDGNISVNELDLYIAERVKELTDGKQTPVTAKPETVRDFPIAVKK